MNHSLQTIAETGSKPMQKAPLPDESHDDRTTGKLVAQEAIGLMLAQHAGWKPIVHRLFTLTIEARKVLADSLAKWRAACIEGTADLHGMSEKDAKKMVNSAAVRLSQINTICKALNGGMTYDTLTHAWECSDPQELSIEAIYKTAKEFSGADARGRKPDTLLVKLGKWIEAQKKGATDMSAEDRQILDEIVKLHNTLAPV